MDNFFPIQVLGSLFYEVNKKGIIRSIDRWITKSDNKVQFYKGKILKPKIDKNGYKVVTFSVNGKKYSTFVHRVLAIKFIPNPLNLPEVNHKDGNKLNNDLDNLEWCTCKYNTQHSFEMGLNVGKKGVKHPMCKLTEKIVLKIRSEKGMTLKEIGSKYGISEVQVHKIVKNKQWTHLKPHE